MLLLERLSKPSGLNERSSLSVYDGPRDKLFEPESRWLLGCRGLLAWYLDGEARLRFEFKLWEGPRAELPEVGAPNEAEDVLADLP